MPAKAHMHKLTRGKTSPLSCPAQAGHPVTPARAIKAYRCLFYLGSWLLDRPPARTMTAERPEVIAYARRRAVNAGAPGTVHLSRQLIFDPSPRKLP